MSSFTTRVELHDAVYTDYETLHAQMAARGFSRIIVSDDGKRYQLPSAEYNFEGQATIERVRELANAAAGVTGRSHAVLVTQGERRAWIGLTEV